MGSTITISAPKVDRTVEVDRDWGVTTAEMVETFGEDVCSSNLKASFTIKLQGAVRAKLSAVNEKGEFLYSDQQAIDAGLAYVPQKAVRGTKKDSYTLLAEQVASGKITKKEMIAQLEKQIAAIEGAGA